MREDKGRKVTIREQKRREEKGRRGDKGRKVTIREEKRRGGEKKGRRVTLTKEN